MTWFDGRRWAVWDTETTAANPLEARLVTACVAFVGGGQPTEVVSHVIDAGVDVPAEAAEIHGYTTERVRAEGKPIVDVLPEIVGYLTTAVAAGCPLVAYNAVYDNTVLDQETRRLGLDPFADVLTGAIVLDPFTIDRHVDRYRKGRRTLAAACEFYDVKLDGAHDSTFDALAAGRVLYRLGQLAHTEPASLRRLYADRRYPNDLVKAFAALGAMSLPELHAAQRGWYAEQAESFAQYLRKAAEQKLHDSALDFPPGDEALHADERRTVLIQEAEELRQRADGVSIHWPLQPLAVAA
jgi:DNA polymerase III subunit epsilon